MDAMHSALADTRGGNGGKRPMMAGEGPGAPEGGAPPAKKRRAAAAQPVKRVFDDPLDTDSEAEVGGWGCIFLVWVVLCPLIVYAQMEPS